MFAEGLKRMSGSDLRAKKATGMNEQQSEGVYCSTEWKGEVGLEVRTDRKKANGEQKASGIGCRGDDKRMPNQSRLFRLAGPFPPAPSPWEKKGPAERSPVRIPESQRVASQPFHSNTWMILFSHQTSRFLQGLELMTLSIKWAVFVCPYRQIWMAA